MKRKLRDTKRKQNAATAVSAGQPLLKKPEAAYFLRISLRTLERLMRDHRVVYLKVGRSVRFCLPDLLAHLKCTSLFS
jgi:excisionase family DNA binding protein